MFKQLVGSKGCLKHSFKIQGYMTPLAIGYCAAYDKVDCFVAEDNLLEKVDQLQKSAGALGGVQFSGSNESTTGRE